MQATSSLLPCSLVALAFVLSHVTQAVIIETTFGPVKGQSLTLNDGKEVNSFLGMPFAKPPVGHRRWKAPEDPDKWTKPFDANHIRSACVQQVPNDIYLTHLFWDDYSEDCLHLNIFSPKDMSKKPYPVMMYVHGGAFSRGANFQYPGHFLAAHDVIVIVPNYRLGALGFASTADSAAPGNYGLLDQIKALHFIKDNIKNFGGDPGQVTIFGQSAGAASVSILTLSPLAKGLFHRAIIQSGSELAFWGLQDRAQRPETYTKQLARNLSCPISDTAAMMDCLRTKPAQQLINFQITCTAGYFCVGFGPVIDGEVLPDHPLVLRNQSSFNQVPTMVGFNREDASFYGLTIPGIEDGLTREGHQEVLAMLSRFLTVDKPKQETSIREALKFYYSPWGQRDNKAANRRVIVEMGTDLSFGMPADSTIKSNVQTATTYAYLFSYISSNASEILPEWMGVTHALEIPYMFGIALLPWNLAVFDEMEFTHHIIDWNTEDINMANYMLTLWTNFAHTGNPTPEPVLLPGNDPMMWTQYDLSRKQTFNIGSKLGHVAFYRQREYAFFREYLPTLLNQKDRK